MTGRRSASRSGAARSARTPARAPRPAASWTARLDPWWPWLQPGLAVLAVTLAWFGQGLLADRHLVAGLWTWAAAAAAALWAFRGQPDRLPEPGFTPRVEAWVLAGIVVVALGFRLYRLDAVPHGYFFDEAVNALEGLQTLLDPKYLPIFGPSDAPLPALHFYLNALALKLGGVSVLSTKVMIALWGTVTVVMVYFLARRVVSVPTALAAALLLAVLRWHVNFSRINFVGISTPLFGAAAMYFLLRGLETKNRWHMALSGLAVSLGLYTYYASNLVPMVIAPYLALQLAWDRQALRTQWKGVAVFLGVSLLVFAPLGLFALNEPGRFFVRNNQVLIFNHVAPDQKWPAFLGNVRTTLLMFNYFGDCNGRHNLPEAPMLDPLTGLLFGLGLAWSLGHLRRRHEALITLWFLAALVPGFLTIEAPQGYRCIGAIVPAVLLAALGLERLWQAAAGLATGFPARRWLWAGPAVLLAAIGVRNAVDYFDRQAAHPASWSEFSCREFAIGSRLHELGGNTHAYISAGSFNYPTIRFLAYPFLDSEPFQGLASIPSRYLGAKDVVYALLPIHDGSLELLKYYYPQGQAQVHPSPYDFTLFTEYRVSREQLRAARGLPGVYTDAAGRRLDRRDGQDGFVLEAPGRGLQGQVRARWTGSLNAPVWSAYRFRLDGAAGWTLRLDGREVPAAGAELAQGLHTLELFASFSAATPSLALSWQRGPGPWAPVPGTDLSPQPVVHGLLASYYPNPDLKDKPALKRVDPLLALLGADFPFSAPFSARYEGFLDAPKTGTYTLAVNCNERARVFVDGEQVVENLTPDTTQEGSVRLDAGRHALRLEYQKAQGAYPQLVLYWTPPGQVKQKVPFTALSPQ
jgi:4-amino-4-deoxy-L-arabinose transferase-like glycosyltransferase